MSRNVRVALLSFIPFLYGCAYASTDGFIEGVDGDTDGPSEAASGGTSSVGSSSTGGSKASGGQTSMGPSTSGGSSGDGSGSGSDPDPDPNPFPFPTFPGPGTSTGGGSGSGGSSANACTPVTCGGTAPKPTGDVCFTFTTTQFGGWQASNTTGCMITFDGMVPEMPGVNPISAGQHELEFSGCTDTNISWSCWN